LNAVAAIGSAGDDAADEDDQARDTGRVMGALRFFFANGSAVTVFVTYVPNSHFRSPQLIGFADPSGMSMNDWDDCFNMSDWDVSRVTSDVSGSV